MKTFRIIVLVLLSLCIQQLVLGQKAAAPTLNGVVVNMPESAKAFSCKAGQPMVNAPEKVCKVW